MIPIEYLCITLLLIVSVTAKIALLITMATPDETHKKKSLERSGR